MNFRRTIELPKSDEEAAELLAQLEELKAEREQNRKAAEKRAADIKKAKEEIRRRAPGLAKELLEEYHRDQENDLAARAHRKAVQRLEAELLLPLTGGPDPERARRKAAEAQALAAGPLRPPWDTPRSELPKFAPEFTPRPRSGS